MISILLYRLKRPWHFVKTGLLQALPAQIRYRFPQRKLKIITITGTDGKTTSSSLLYHVLKQAGKNTALISTVACYIGSKEIKTGLHVTSPSPSQLYELLHQMVEAEVEYVVLEITSHGAYQFRTWGISPIIAGLTNISPEHLDYHLNLREYIKAKSLILKKAQHIILNRDDSHYSTTRKTIARKANQIQTYSVEDSIPQQVAEAISRRFPEAYNHANSRLVYSIAKVLEIPDNQIAKAIQSFAGIPGRMQTVSNDPIKVVVDFAHTPQGIEAALTALQQQLTPQDKRKNRTGKLIAVYGAAGLRDHKKRPVMGRIGAELADLVVFTAEDPRTEDVWSIIRQLKQNLSENLDKVMSIADRGEAIQFAINQLAEPGDVVAILGKGHEQSICYEQTEYHWSDVSIAEKVLAGKELGELTPVS